MAANKMTPNLSLVSSMRWMRERERETETERQRDRERERETERERDIDRETEREKVTWSEADLIAILF
jgi:hypothetical protein